VLEVKVTSYGVLAVGGLISLILGSLMLVDSPLPELQVGLRMIVPITLAVGGIILFLVQLSVTSQRAATVTGSAGMLAETGRALSAFGPGAVGQVQTHGEIWTARAEMPIHAGDTVRVVAVSGLVLTVVPEPAAPAAARRL
jgi:membrane-bound serine protease (ClpP class)